MLLMALLTSVYILTGTFHALLTFIGITEYLTFILTVLALFHLRLHPPPSPPSPLLAVKPTAATIYRTNTVNPVMFCMVTVFLVAKGLVAEPAQGGAIVGVLGVGWGVWRWRKREVGL
jgi:hypothetical protein